MNITQHFRKYFFLFLLVLAGFGAFFVDLSVSVPASRWDIDTPQYTSIQIEIGGIANAQAKKNTELKDAEQENQQTINRVIAGLNWAAGIVTALVSPAIGLLGWLLSPDWTSGDLFGLRQYLYKLWITVSNIIYFIYAIALIIVAVMTMFNSKNYGARQLLPRLVVGILMVPFTWWIVQWAVSFSTVLTASVLSIPMETISQNSDKDSWWESRIIPTCVAFWNPDTTDEESTACSGEEGTKKISPKEFTQKSGGIYGNIAIYAYGVFKIQKVKQINTTGINGVKTAAAIIHKGFIGLIMFLIFGILTIAMIFVLFMRVFKLWAYAIFSPLFTFGFVFKNLLWKADKDGTFTIQEFLGLVFLPAIVGLVLSFGLILINALNGVDAKQENMSGDTCTAEKLKFWKACQVAKIMGNPENKIVRTLEPGKNPNEKVSLATFHWGGLKMKWYGESQTAAQTAKEVEAQKWTLSTIGGAFGVIVLDFIAIAFIWIAFMAAKGVSKTAKTIMDPIENAGKTLTNTLKQALLYASIPGIGNLRGLTIAANRIQSQAQIRAEEEYHNSKLWKMFWKPPVTAETKKVISDNRQMNSVEKVNNISIALKSVQNDGNGKFIVQELWNSNIDMLAENLKQNWASVRGAFDPVIWPRLKPLLDKWMKNTDDRNLFIAYLLGYKWVQTSPGAVKRFLYSKNEPGLDWWSSSQKQEQTKSTTKKENEDDTKKGDNQDKTSD